MGTDASQQVLDAAKLRAALEQISSRAPDDPRQLAGLAVMALAQGLGERAYALARKARQLAPDDPDIANLVQRPLAALVPAWHFGIVQDDARNAAWDAALRRAVRPGSRVLDIGAGTGLLAMMAVRAGAAEVVSCEANPAVADAASRIVARNGFEGRIKVVAKHSSALDPEADLGGPVDLIVSEIVSANVLSQSALTVMGDARARLLKPGGTAIPAAIDARVALAHWQGLDAKRMGTVSGFDLSAFNDLEKAPYKIKVGDPQLSLLSEPADLFRFSLRGDAALMPRQRDLGLVSLGGHANGVAQWIRIQLDEHTTYENRPGRCPASCWACVFYPFPAAVDAPAGTRVTIRAAHDLTSLRLRLLS